MFADYKNFLKANQIKKTSSLLESKITILMSQKSMKDF